MVLTPTLPECGKIFLFSAPPLIFLIFHSVPSRSFTLRLKKKIYILHFKGYTYFCILDISGTVLIGLLFLLYKCCVFIDHLLQGRHPLTFSLTRTLFMLFLWIRKKSYCPLNVNCVKVNPGHAPTHCNSFQGVSLLTCSQDTSIILCVRKAPAPPTPPQ